MKPREPFLSLDELKRLDFDVEAVKLGIPVQCAGSIRRQVVA